jgi:putative ABC transport system permease protein
MAGAINRGVSIDGRPDPPPPSSRSMDFYTVTPAYFRALGIAVLRGRAPAPSDTATSQPVAVVNEAFAREYFPGEDPIGRRFGYGRRDDDRHWPTIVGIVADVRQRRLTTPAAPQAFIPASQDSEPWNLLSVIVKTGGDPLALSTAVRKAVLEVEATQPVSDIRSLEQALARTTATRRFTLLLVSAFAGAALLLAAVGTFGVMAHAVVSRTRELGIRLALGAQPHQVIGPILAASAAVAAAASAAGLGVGAVAGRAARALLFEVGPFDPGTFATSAAVLMAVALVASYLPLLRVMASDPTRALREE